jgi:hypothetical protein
MTREQILHELWTNGEVDDIIRNITGGHHLSEDLKGELFLILSEMDGIKIIGAWQGKWIKYMIINIILKQWRSSTSPFHKKFRPPLVESKEAAEVIEEESTDWNLVEKVLVEIEKLPFVEKELIKMRYKLGNYGVGGELEDPNCNKVVYSYRKIEKRLMLGEISIDHNTVQKYHNKSLEKIRKKLE